MTSEWSSTIHTRVMPDWVRIDNTPHVKVGYAPVVELADTSASKVDAARRVGSNPTGGTQQAPVAQT